MMRTRLLLATTICWLPAAGQARAAACSPGVGVSCIGEVTRTTQPQKFGAVRPALVKAGRPVPANARLCFVGQSRIGARLWLSVDRSDLMFDAAAIALPPGCKLDTLDTSEPD